MVEVKISGQTHGYIIRTIIGIIELLDILQTRVFQVFRRTDDAVLTIRNIGVQRLVNRQIHLIPIHGRVHVKLLINGL